MKLQTIKDIFIIRLQQPVFVFALSSAIILFLYRNTIGSRLVTDALNWLQAYQSQGFSGILHSFGDVSQHYSYHFLFYGLYVMFGVNEIGYYFFFSVMQAANVTLLFFVVKYYLEKIEIQHSFSIALFSAILFMFQPYQTEAVVWGATIHYLTLTTAFLVILHLQLRWKENTKVVLQLIISALFLFATYLHILAITFPILIAILIFPLHNFSVQKTIRHLWPMLLVTVAYIASNFIVVGSASGHKADYTESAISFTGIISNLSNYVLKDFILLQFFPYTYRAYLYALTENLIVVLCACAIILCCLYIFFKNNLQNKLLYLTATFILLFITALLPVLPLYFYFVTPIEADRLAYFPLLFSSVIISVIVHQFKNYAKWFAAAIIFFFSVLFLSKNISAWADSARLQKKLESTFPVSENGTTYLLNVPDNYRGAYLYREDSGESKLEESLVFKQNMKDSNIHEIMQWNMQHVNDGVEISIIDSVTLEVRFAQFGNWWWLAGKGATNYSNAITDVKLSEDGMSYTVKFKQKSPEDTFVYLKNMQWFIIEDF